ncbi:MAG: hypothetical protein IT252_12080 [Chitinophagaceae bacterium]|nr:hypothetical protein [Chitinophagaceae bacterium]
MTDKQLKNKLSKIGYTTLWLDYGVLTIDYLIEQEQTFDNSDDQNTEHYRYHTFRHYLSSKNKLSDIEFDNYLELTFADNDQLMAGSAAVDLFTKVNLTDFQFEKLSKSIGHFGEWTEKVVTRQTLLRQLKASKLTTALFRECLVKGDSAIHEYILDISDLNQLQELAINGKNKKIRNIASEKVKRLTRQQNSR